MTFIHGYILGGLLLIGVPVLLHLIMRQKPKHLSFPAFRFLRQRHLINRRKLRLQHLLLLLLRMGIIAALCLALARPRLAAERISILLSDERPVAAVLLFDTSASMEYSAAGQDRLEEAKQRARELLDEMDGGSQVALLDSSDDVGEGGTEWTSPSQAQTRLENLRVRPTGAALNRPIERALRLLEKSAQSEEPPPRFLYVFSDRTRSCWDAQSGTPKPPDGIRVLFVDVGVEKPSDLALEKVEVVPPIAAPGGHVQIQVTVRATGADFDTELLCSFENETEPDHAAAHQAIRLTAGESRVFVFEHDVAAKPTGASGETIRQVTVKHQTPDALPFNNTSFATFLIRERRKVLTLVGDKKPDKGPPPWKAWQTVLKVMDAFTENQRTADDVKTMDDKTMRDHAIVCVFQIAPNVELWQKLERYVRGGGSLIIVPGGEEMLVDRQRFNDEGARVGLLPGSLGKIERNPPDRPLVRWSDFPVNHPLPAFFRKTMLSANPDFGKEESWPGVNAYWLVAPAKENTVTLATYADAERHPALLERSLGQGHVILFTTPMDGRELDRSRYWHNYWGLDSSFGLVLVDQVYRYLAGDSTSPELNYFCGQVPRLQLHASPPPLYTLDGPNLAVSETSIKGSPSDNMLPLPQAVSPGNYVVGDTNNRVLVGCSLNVHPRESDLERVPADEIESLLGKDTLLQVGRSVSLKDALTGLRPPPVELLPWLMMAVLIVLAVESLLANRFYRRGTTPATGEPAAGVPAQP
jgi:hypothetical protein